MPFVPDNHRAPQVGSQHKPEQRWGKGRGGRRWRNKRERVFKRDKYLCQIHLGKGILRPVSIHGKDHGVCDHITPLSKGGTDTEDNLQTICQACDKAKTATESNN